METLIRTEALRRVFKADEIETNALNGVNLQIRKGEFVAVMGPSGCGKSTLLNILGLLDQPTAGSYHFLGNEVSGLTEKQRASLRKHHIGFVFQNFNLIEELTVAENVELPLIYLRMTTAERRRRVAEVLDQMQIEHRRKYYPNQLSGGHQQRVALARAIVASPDLILADEPTGNLDSVNGDEVMGVLESLNRRGATIIIVTHSQRDAGYGNRVIRLFDGQIINEDIRQHSDYSPPEKGSLP